MPDAVRACGRRTKSDLAVPAAANALAHVLGTGTAGHRGYDSAQDEVPVVAVGVPGARYELRGVVETNARSPTRRPGRTVTVIMLSLTMIGDTVMERCPRRCSPFPCETDGCRRPPARGRAAPHGRPPGGPGPGSPAGDRPAGAGRRGTSDRAPGGPACGPDAPGRTAGGRRPPPARGRRAAPRRSPGRFPRHGYGSGGPVPGLHGRPRDEDLDGRRRHERTG